MQKKNLVHLGVVLVLTVLFVSCLFFALQYQSRGVDLVLEPQSISTDNLVTNPGFEPPPSATEECGGNPVPHSWRCRLWAGDATMLWDSNLSFRGTHSVIIFGHNEDVDALWVSDEYFSVSAGTQYSFAGWIRADYLGDNARAYLRLRFNDNAGGLLQLTDSNYVIDSTLSEPNGGWVQVKGSALAPKDAERARLVTLLHKEGYARFDNVIVSESAILPFLVLDVVAEPSPVSPAGTLTYTVSLINTGGSPANSVFLTSTLDSRMILDFWKSDQSAEHTQNDSTHTWHFINGLPAEGDSLSLTLIVSVNAEIDVYNPLTSTFEASAEGVAPIILVKKTLIDFIDFELSDCPIGLVVPERRIDYLLSLTNTGSYSISFTIFPFNVPENCGTLEANPLELDSVQPFQPVPITLTFNAANQSKYPAMCFPTLFAEAPNGKRKKSTCNTYAYSNTLDLKVGDTPEYVNAGNELTYTLIYTYVGGISPSNLHLTFTLKGQSEISRSVPSSEASASDQFFWSRSPNPLGGTDRITVVASVPLSATGIVTALAEIGFKEVEPITRFVTTTIIPVEYRVNLPHVMRNHYMAAICDPDFEHNSFEQGCWNRGWTGNVSAPLPKADSHPLAICPNSSGPSNPASKQFAVLLGSPSLGSGVEHEDIPVGSWWIEQTFPINPSSPPLTLTFHYRILQYGLRDIGDNLIQDTFEVKINSSKVFSDGNDTFNYNCHDIDWSLPPEAVKDPNTGWVKVNLPLDSDNNGSEVTVRFEVWNRNNPDAEKNDYEYYNIWAYVDKIELSR